MLGKNWYKSVPIDKDFKVVDLGARKLNPEMCKELLEYSQDVENRSINKARLKEYVEAMVGGVFKETGRIIWVNKNGKLIDGQHRIASVIQANKTITFLILQIDVDDGENGVFDFPIDWGQRRTLAQETGETKSYCSAVEFFHKIICRNSTRTTPQNVFSMRKIFKEKNIDELVHTISGKKASSKKICIQRCIRCALITAAYLGYNGIEDIWNDFYNKNPNPIAVNLWIINNTPIIEHQSTVLPQPVEREYYYKTLLYLKQRKEVNYTSNTIENLEKAIIPEISKIFD
jgi:hypothetical protein